VIRPYQALSARIEKEQGELAHVVARCLDIWQQSEATGDDRYVDGVALNLHAFYSGLERILELIVAEIDQTKPGGSAWHQELLRQAATDIPDVRPAVISDATRHELDRYRGFRHVVRNVYAFELDKELIAPLIRELPSVFAVVQADLEHFSRWLAAAANETN
jgi:hypothetical protein